MAGAGAPVKPQVIGSTAATTEAYNKHSRCGPIPVSSSNGYGVAFEPLVAQGPSCLFIGPVETASKETLEALYCQARDSYYNGSPLIVDDMFDRVELKLRWYGSKYVVKYPRCSLRKQSTYADAQCSKKRSGQSPGRLLIVSAMGDLGDVWAIAWALGDPESSRFRPAFFRTLFDAKHPVNYIYAWIAEDPSQVLALASLWILILGFGGSVCLVPIMFTIVRAYHDAVQNGATYASQTSMLMYIVMGSVMGYPIASASVAALQEIWKNDLVALKGVCPNCGEEVFAFVRSNQSDKSHRSECHVCESFLEFRTTVERSISGPSRRWVHGRVYLIRQKRSRRQKWP